MKGSETKLVSYMQGSDKRFVIPVYQRNYDWKTENCKQLYDDLIKVIRRGRKSHFFGSIVSVHNDGGFNEYLVIDGQQRLTTISLLLLAMYNLMEKGIIVSVITDAGMTEFHGVPTKTCLALEPLASEIADELTGDLPLY